MAGECSSSWPKLTLEPPRKRVESHRDKEPYKSSKAALLQSLSEAEDTLKQLGHDALRKRVEDLRGKVKDVLEDQEEEIKNLRREVKDLTNEVSSLRAERDELREKKDKLEQKLALAQVTWSWEAHLARFVVDSNEEIYKDGRFDQMSKYLKKTSWRNNLWRKIQSKVTHWTARHWQVVNNIRKERNCIAHPDLINFDYVESELAKISPEYRKKMKDMLEMLKMTASLMKFGRLARTYNGMDTLTRDSRKRLNEIISWDRQFEDIEGLQNMEHEEAKKYLRTYVANPGNIREYFFLVDLIKHENSKQLGKLAWKFEKIYPSTNQEAKDALERLKALYPKSEYNNRYFEESISFGVDVARLHIPDFLPKNLWKHGMEIVEKYFDYS